MPLVRKSRMSPHGSFLISVPAWSNAFAIRSEYLAVVRPRLIEFTWLPDWQEPQTIVRFELEESEGRTTVRLTHSGFADSESSKRYQGWPWLLSMLDKHVETTVSGRNESSA